MVKERDNWYFFNFIVCGLFKRFWGKKKNKKQNLKKKSITSRNFHIF
jgi:hypothetical protein